MYREKIRDVENFKSDEFKGLKEKDEELLYGTGNTEAVMGVQNFLNEEGVRDSKGEYLTVDGIYGANTANAVMNYQRANGLTVDGIVGDETWNSIYNRKKKREENASFEESLKSKSGGFFYDRIQNIRKAQRDMGITPSGKIDEENESSAEDDFHGRVRRQWERGKNPDLWNTPKIENFPYKPGTRQEIRERKRPDREQMPWEAIREIQGRNIPNKTGETGVKEQPLTSGVKQSGINAHLNFIPDYTMKNPENNVEAEKPYIFPLGERANEASVEYEPAGEFMSNAGKKKNTQKASETTEEKEVKIIQPGYNAKGEWSEDPDADNYGKDSDTYKMLNDLNSRCETGTKEEKAKYYSVAEDIRRLEKEGTPIKYAQDEIMNLLHENAEIAKAYQNNLKSGYTGIMYNLEGGNYFIDSVAFLISMAYGKWNYKYNDEWRVPYKIFDGNDMKDDNNRNWRPWMYFDGMLISADKLGNMNMAYVGTKMGLPKFVFQNFLTEDKDDAFWVQYGIDLAEQGR